MSGIFLFYGVAAQSLGFREPNFGFAVISCTASGIAGYGHSASHRLAAFAERIP